MKTTLKILALLLGFGAACVAFAGLVGLDSFSAFFTSGAPIAVYSMAGLMLIGVTDSPRRPRSLLAPVATASTAPDRSVAAYGLGRRTRLAA